ncbi:hypothetical protein [Actinosynnema sp. NPDC020468]
MTTYEFVGLAGGTSHTIYIRAADAANNVSPAGDSVTFATPQ